MGHMTAGFSALQMTAGLLALAALLLAGCIWLRLRGNRWATLLDDSAAVAASRALAAGVLAGGATSLAGAAAAVAIGDAPPGSPWHQLLRPGPIAALSVAALLLLFHGGATLRRWLLLGAGVASLVPWAMAPLALQLDARAELAPLPLGVAAAVLCSLVLSSGRHSRLVALARIAATRAAGDGILVVDSRDRIFHANDTARKALNLAAEPARPEVRAALPVAIQELLSEPEGRRLRLKSASGRFFEAWLTGRQGTGPMKGMRALLLRDITGRYRDERRLVRLAHYDSLTGLGNRRLFLDNVKQAIAAASASGDLAALLYLDLDRFKEINDSLGHAAGDTLLQTLAERFRDYLRSEDLEGLGIGAGARVGIARLAGDEFAIIAPRLTDPEVAAELARRLLRLAERPIEIAERSLTCSASIGIALFPKDAHDVETLLRHADSALYAAKSRGRNRFAFYESSFDAKAERRHTIEQGLREALERGGLRLHYQPKIDVVLGTVVGLEALLRWKSDELGEVGPGEFIPVAEERGLIGTIGAWCLHEASGQIRSWREAGFAPVPVSVNVSSAQFQDTDLQRVVSEALTRHEVDPQLLELELTESLLLEEGENTALTLRDLRAIGVRIALDDFGTGYSALTYLNRFPLDVLKMDRGLLRDIETNPAAAGIASAVVSMAHSLGLCVVAEGIDSEGQLPLLRKMHCDQIQGFLYAPALPAEDVQRFLARPGEQPPIAEFSASQPGRLPAGTEATEELEKDDPAPPDVLATPPIPQIDADLPSNRMPDAARQDHDEPRAELPATSSADSEVRRSLLRTADDGCRVLLLDDGSGAVGPLALRLSRLGIDVHYASALDEARLFVAQERAAIRLLAVPPTIDLGHAQAVRAALTRETGATPPLVVIGEKPGAATRSRIREAGATWTLWAPFDDIELRFVLKSALALPRELSLRREPRVPVDLVAKVQAGGRREMAVMSSLSPRGAFVEMSDPLPVGSQLRLEFELSTDRFRLFARVVHRQQDDPDRPLSAPAGMSVVFHEPDRAADLALRKAVEESAARYLP
jgi:diguanylate cyclase (GGDEF)-like protein